ncbi:mRNA-decapping enzyme 1A-like [Hydractinia symbiolongicarpus]|uniref:mRNA-decapping enzyme 1A-like n=1 Tax=Hydractinia symbiolongicarpus TaxID=13093 RepID=UPI00254DF116|nr:mRNA-decapping enzyme 1A-like [Hydractinia symbiolongicarpus]
MAENMAGKTKAEMQINLSVLRKHDPEIEQIIDTASSVAHYKFNSTTNQWEKTEVEGSLFLYSRKVSPIVVIFIMNRLNKHNTKLVLSFDMEFKIQEPFLLCKASNSEIIGIWFYDAAECQRFGFLLSRLGVLAKDDRSLKIAVMTELQKKNQAPSTQQNGILGLFTKAQEEFDSTKIKPKNVQKPKQQKHGKQQQNKTNLQKRNSEPIHEQLRIAAKQPTKLSPKSARKEEIRKKQESFRDQHLKEQEALLNILHGGEVRKPFRARTVSSSDGLDLDLKAHNSGFSSKAGDLAVLDQLGIVHEQNRNHDVKAKAIGCAELESSFRNKSETELSGRSSADILRTVHSSPNISRIASSSQLEKASASTTSCLSLVLNNSPSSNTTVNLLSPSVMTSKAGRGRGTAMGASLNSQQKISIAANFSQPKTAKKLFPDESKMESKFPDAPSGAALKSLMSPAAFQRSTATTTVKTDVDTLTKPQLQEALVYMIQNDEQFINALHSAYLEARKR